MEWVVGFSFVYYFVVLEIEPMALGMLGKFTTTELHDQPSGFWHLRRLSLIIK